MSKLKTINLKGKQYIPVEERVKHFNETYPEGSIVTEVTFKDNTVYFKARIYPNSTMPAVMFTGHSFGELGKEKAFEKLETVAVGRALAFMGIGIVDGIASADEMHKFNSSNSANTQKSALACQSCGQVITEKVAEYSKSKLGKELCMDCQKK